jgi:hypothetical protein
MLAAAFEIRSPLSSAASTCGMFATKAEELRLRGEDQGARCA